METANTERAKVQGGGVLAGYASEVEAAAELGVTSRTMRSWRQKRIGPAWTEVGRTIFYSRAGITRWLSAKEVDPVRNKRGGVK